MVIQYGKEGRPKEVLEPKRGNSTLAHPRKAYFAERRGERVGMNYNSHSKMFLKRDQANTEQRSQ